MFWIFASTIRKILEIWCLTHCVCFLRDSATFIIKAELQLLQSIIYPGGEKLCRHSLHCSLLHIVITPGILNHSSFYIGVREWRIFGTEFISVTMLNGQCLHWCVHFSSVTQQFLSASVHNVDFCQGKKKTSVSFPEMSDSPDSLHDSRFSCIRVVFLSPRRWPSVLSTGHTPPRAPL